MGCPSVSEEKQRRKRGEEGDALVRMQKQENKKVNKEFRMCFSRKVDGMVKEINIYYHLNNICKHQDT